MSYWLEVFRAMWPVAVSLGALSSTAIFLWLATKFVSKVDHTAANKLSNEKIAALEVARADHATRIRLVEDHIEASPTRQELHDEISGLGERMSAVEAGMKGIGKQLDTTNRYLHTLIEKAVPGASSGGRG
jgi:hypothetical protein